MDDSDLIIIKSSNNLNNKEERRIDGIPRSFANDNLERFSFGSSFSAHRNSFSQPVTSIASNDKDRPDVDAPVLSTQAAALVSPVKKRTKKIPSVLDEFFGVYCLISRSPLKHYKNRCYIGYTVDPNRRITQHNGGREKGGAKKTDNKGPWDMVCIIHGFPNSVAALRFEWAWQNPEKSTIIKGLQLKKERTETPFAFRLRVACHLLNTLPFCRFALTFRWLLVSEELPFPATIPPPGHVGSAFGLVKKTTTNIPQTRHEYVDRGSCRICHKDIPKLPFLVRCLSSSCSSHFHTRCMAEHSLKNNPRSSSLPQLVPLNVSCPLCHRRFLWGDVIRDQRMILKVSESQPEDLLRSLVPVPLSD